MNSTLFQNWWMMTMMMKTTYRILGSLEILTIKKRFIISEDLAFKNQKPLLHCEQATILFWNNFLSALKTVQLKPTLSSYEKKEKTGLDLKSKLLNRTWCIWKRKPFMERTRFFSQEDEYNFSASYTWGPRIVRILELPGTASIL